MDLSRAKALFFEASTKSYANTSLYGPATFTALPGSEMYHYEWDYYLYIDCYYSSKEKFCGQTNIWFKKTPIWCMQYQGFWKDERIVPFLKSALIENYEKKVFTGGRGPNLFIQENFVYTNCVEANEFHDFYGIEEIQENGIVLLRTHYSGLAL